GARQARGSTSVEEAPSPRQTVDSFVEQKPLGRWTCEPIVTACGSRHKSTQRAQKKKSRGGHQKQTGEQDIGRYFGYSLAFHKTDLQDPFQDAFYSPSQNGGSEDEGGRADVDEEEEQPDEDVDQNVVVSDEDDDEDQDADQHAGDVMISSDE
ncbi:unnamed protein product, partial [Amoebophrya sp. A120]